MAGEIAYDYEAGKSTYVHIFNRTSGYIFNGTTFEVYSSNSGNLATYAVAATELGSASAHNVANMPVLVPAGTYDIVAKNQTQAPFLESDQTVAGGQVEWTGVKAAPLSDTATSGQLARFLPVNMPRSVAVPNYGIYLVSSLDHVTPFVSGVISGQIRRDGGNWGPLQSGSFTEKGLGSYDLLALTSGDLNASAVFLLFTATGISGGSSDPLPQFILTQPISGY